MKGYTRQSFIHPKKKKIINKKTHLMNSDREEEKQNKK